ncbi:SufB/SufD family protein [Brockia lithotrophica]|uniref:Fe-S cluster assembly protein SufD n=1 Tax=Brockia lithotrophica TaxID=933949 RepID=A0A660KXF4_9BACL|nr:SufD family Fe-S cluster assembly protein [Brockia lithotrophica]RKQ84706.1 Fe-S cluster assembly protein SufD [Brockia lithotrophica]
MATELLHAAEAEGLIARLRALGEPEWLLNRRKNALARVGELAYPHIEKYNAANLRIEEFSHLPEGFGDRAPEFAERELAEPLSAFLPSGAMAEFLAADGALVRAEIAPHLREQGVLLLSLREAASERPELVEPYLGTAVPDGSDRLTALSAALWQEGAFLYVPPGVEVAEPLEIVWVATDRNEGLARHTRTLVVAGRGSRFTLVERRLFADDVRVLATHVAEVFAADGAQVNYQVLHVGGRGARRFEARTGRVGRDASLDVREADLGDADGAILTTLLYDADGGRGTIRFAGIGSGKQRGAYTFSQIHRSRATESRTLVKAILKDEAHHVFNAITHIHKGAKKSTGKQTTRLLMLGGRARGDANPFLFIDDNDLYADHAASAGRVDDLQLFYLMSRGLSRAEAERLLVLGFLEEVLRDFTAGELPEQIARGVERKLGLVPAEAR